MRKSRIRILVIFLLVFFVYNFGSIINYQYDFNFFYYLLTFVISMLMVFFVYYLPIFFSILNLIFYCNKKGYTTKFNYNSVFVDNGKNQYNILYKKSILARKSLRFISDRKYIVFSRRGVGLVDRNPLMKFNSSKIHFNSVLYNTEYRFRFSKKFEGDKIIVFPKITDEMTAVIGSNIEYVGNETRIFDFMICDKKRIKNVLN